MKTLRERIEQIVGNHYMPSLDSESALDKDPLIAGLFSFISSECERARGEAIKETLDELHVRTKTHTGAQYAQEIRRYIEAYKHSIPHPKL